MRYTLLFLLVLSLILTACKKDAPKISLDDLPTGNVERGDDLFHNGKSGVTACATCHSTDDTKQAGPGMGGFGERAGGRVDGESALEYTYYSILRPSRYIVTGFSNVMPSDYEDKLDAQDIADLVAYLLSL